ncbi:MAG: RnfABCDGE type electron transport complex subunit D, partial [Lentisphaeria bacterium]|nr:RnfABCDGE type electron transport complex subunit D [Lentisphaeria bacterium]
MKQVEEVILPPAGSLLLSSSPHIHQGENITTIMLKVLICLMPAIVASICMFGLNALLVLLYCTAFCTVFEYLWNLFEVPKYVSYPYNSGLKRSH